MTKKIFCFLALTFTWTSWVIASDNDRASSVINNNIYPYPLTHVDQPIGFRSEPWGYQTIPPGFREKPFGYRDIPLNYQQKILTDIGLPRGYSINPPNFIEKDSHPLVNKDPSNQMSTDTHPQSDNDPTKKISVADHPEANKNIVKN